jgi:hypothetical protein
VGCELRKKGKKIKEKDGKRICEKIPNLKILKS